MKPLPPKAKYWEISNSDDVLSSWEDCTVSHTNASSSSSLVITDLSVEYCKVPLHNWRLLQHLPGLSSLTINDCGDLTGSPETSHNLSLLKTLCLVDTDFEELPKWIGEITSLHDLDIRECIWLKGLNENMRQLTNLQSLYLFFCNSIESLPHWLGELSSLEELAIQECDVLRSLPESIQQLTCLQKLDIRGCPQLKHVVESEEGNIKLTHNQERLCLLPTSLQELKIEKCSGINCLPEGIQQLTNLHMLHINGCPELNQWCELVENKMKLAHIQEKECIDLDSE